MLQKFFVLAYLATKILEHNISVPECIPVMKRPMMIISGTPTCLLKPMSPPATNTSTVLFTSVPLLHKNKNQQNYKFNTHIDDVLNFKTLWLGAVPSKFGDQHSHSKGAYQSTNGENGHGNGVKHCDALVAQAAPITPHCSAVIKVLYVLERCANRTPGNISCYLIIIF